RMVRSISRSVQRKRGLASGITVLSACATEMPGYRCPPVPPPARKMVIGSDITEGEPRTRLRRAADGPLAPDFLRHEVGKRSRARGAWFSFRFFFMFIPADAVEQSQRRARDHQPAAAGADQR